MDYFVQILTRALQYIQAIQITDVLDIAILAFLIYKILTLAKRTSTGGVLRGVALVILALAVSSVAHLNALNFILNRVLEMGVLALIIVFQPEIRRFLEQMGRSVFSGSLPGRGSSSSELEQAIEQTVEAYSSMSKDKCGALMVFERKNNLNDCIRSGTPMDSVINAELLKNLFWNKAPLHDGAVIVRDGRIVGAGCMLPLSGNVNLSRDLGMRHRAGIGITEHTDAVVAIVSEETGSISVAVGGMLKRHLAPDTLERLLRNELIPTDSETPKTGPAKILPKTVKWLGRKDERKNAPKSH